MNYDPRWRLYHHQSHWSYLQLEKLRHHQNTQCLLRQANLNSNNINLPIARQLLQPNNYNQYYKINKTITNSLSSFICTDDTYFHQKQLHLNAMIKKISLPILFITLSMIKSHQIHLYHILSNTDNNDTLPTNRPYHCTNYFIHKFTSLKKELYKKLKLIGFDTIINFFDKVEF